MKAKSWKLVVGVQFWLSKQCSKFMDEVLENRGLLKQASVSIIHISNLLERKPPVNALKRGDRSFKNNKYQEILQWRQKKKIYHYQEKLNTIQG